MDVMMAQLKDKSKTPFWSFLNLALCQYDISTSFWRHVTAVENLEQGKSENFLER